jgi:uncharacterized protein (DUF885 family)
MKIKILAAMLALTPAAALADGLKEVIADHWAWRLEQDPVFATSVGVRAFDTKLRDGSVAAFDAAIGAEKAFLERLDALDRSAFTPDDALNSDLLRLQLAEDVEGAKYGGKYLAIANRSGPHTYITGLPDELPFFTKADYESYLARLGAAPRYVDGIIETLRAGIKAGWTQPCAPMKGYEQSIAFHVVDDPKKSAMWAPFQKKPAAISAGDWKKLQQKGSAAIASQAVPALAKFRDFYVAEYKPACREDVGASSMPGGAEWYAYSARVYTTTGKTPDEIHKLGLSEVARIRKEMDAVIRQAKFKGDFEAFQNFLRTDARFYAKTPEELMEANALVAKRIEGELPRLFGRLPRMPYTLKEIPADIAEGTTTAYYEPPAGDGARAGVYRVNTSKLETRPLYEIEALTLHEAVPGHHLQIALAQELDLPEFRKHSFTTAFVEGWGLYAESLGLDAGMYEDPYSNFGRLSYEMWRACRLVVDTGLHVKGWTRDQAIEYMAANTVLSRHNIEAEIDRYLTNPGQALAYKIGQLKLLELRKRAVRELGPKFDLRRFHDAVLENGAVPLSVLEAKIGAFIRAEKTR